MSAKAGMYFDTGSASDSLPSSIRIMAATVVIGLVIEAMRKIVSLVIGALVSLSRKPKESNITILPLRAISTTAPGSSLFFTPSSRRSLSRFRRVDWKPTSSGDCALGMPCAATGSATETASAAMAARRVIDIGLPPRNFGRAGPSASCDCTASTPRKIILSYRMEGRILSTHPSQTGRFPPVCAGAMTPYRGSRKAGNCGILEVSGVSGVSGASASDFALATVLFRQLKSPWQGPAVEALQAGVRRRAAPASLREKSRPQFHADVNDHDADPRSSE